MKKTLLTAAIAVLVSGTAFADSSTIDISSAVNAATGAFSVSTGGATSYQGGTVTSQNLSFGQVKSSDVDGTGYLPTSLASQFCNKDALDAKYTTDTHTLEGTAFSGGKVTTSTFGSGTGFADSYGSQEGSTKVNATIKPENDGITLTVSPEAAVAGEAWSHTTNTGSDYDQSIAQAGETSTASVTVFTNPKIKGEDYETVYGRNKVHHEGEWHSDVNAPQIAVLATATSGGALCVGSRCELTKNVGTYTTSTGNGNWQAATTYSLKGSMLSEEYSLSKSTDATAQYQNITPVNAYGQPE
jgi:hypothetical protein